ncbi:MAG: isopentenyl-diphosphate delta-isomerase [Lentimonas sp.]|jgi:isopentenyl-diphosphate delta-isomerase
MAATEEYFDVVDAEDRVLRTETRSNVHRQKLMHRAIHVFVFNSDGQLYLQRRSMTKDTAPGKWVSSCSGHLNSGEVYLDAARRELGEEIGLYLSAELTPVLKQKACKPTGYEFVWLYRCRAEGPFVLDAEEVSEGQWIDLDALNVWLKQSPRDFAWSFVYLWGKFLAWQAASGEASH